MTVRLDEPAGRWVLLTTVLGSAMAMLDSTVVNVALPTLGAELHAGVAGLQWVVNAYLLTLSSLILVGGSLGDRFGRRRIFVLGVLGFAVASMLCGAAYGVVQLALARALQGIFGALLTPGSLALIQSSIHRDDRARAVGLWSGLSGVAAAVGPFVGGLLVDTASWRWLFFLNVPLAVLVWFASRHVTESHAVDDGHGAFDLAGALACVLGLGSLTYALVEADWRAGVVGLVACAAFVVVERRSSHPMMPLGMFRSLQFSAANVITLCAYGALSGTLFYLVLYLQIICKYPATRAGLALLPMTLVMLSLSSWIGGLAGRIGPRLPMTLGCLVSAFAMLLFSRLGPHDAYPTHVLPAALVFGLGMTGVAVPVTVTVLASTDPARSGIASGINNAVARVGSLLAIAALPLLTGLVGADYTHTLPASYRRAMLACAALFAVSALLSGALLRRPARDVADAGK